MEVIDGRGISCGNEVYFDYVDGEVVITMYRDVPGVRMDVRAPNVIKAFSKEDWVVIQAFLMRLFWPTLAGKHEKVEGVFSDLIDVLAGGDPEVSDDGDDGHEEEERVRVENEISIFHNQRINSSVSANTRGEPIFPGKGLPSMTKAKESELEEGKEKEKNGKENNESDSETETSP
ncbi:hypothetical protein LCGC14_0915440 [marine sediment metagenome]|uniref:Uncharacterized protein n=1 Tax=marine sediment metagenome TaxID=412755 RepID=A0A0F9NSE9_9ZZZZ